MKLVQMADPVRYARMTTEELRATFLLEGMFAPGKIEFAYVDLDRTVIGSAVPVGGALTLETEPELRAEYFLERRELGVFNVGGAGTVLVDGVSFELEKLDCLYIGRGSRSVTFSSKSGEVPACFYLLSYPAHATYPTTLAKKAQATAVKLGTEATANKRTIYKFIHQGGIQSCQLVMGLTALEPGSVWNSFPPHTHWRRTEIYFYFDLGEKVLAHFFGKPQETRHLFLHNEEVALSPSWSMHFGVGTGNYKFIWGMAGENQTFDDMDAVKPVDLK